MSSIPAKQPAAPEPTETLEERFRRLAATWGRATAYLSSMTEASNHPAYQEIIGLGLPVVPLLLRDMEANHTHWFRALREITGVSPIPKSAAGNVPKMVEVWLEWGKANGYQW